MINSLNDKFIAFADWTSWAIGTPLNMLFWTILLGIWFWFWIANPHLASGDPATLTWMPLWLWEPVVQLPVNGVTTLAELYIGFLIAAAANRMEKRSRELHQRMLSVEEANEVILLHLESIVDQLQTAGPVD